MTEDSRQAGAIEATREMIDAGVDAYLNIGDGDASLISLDERVTQIWSAMHLAHCQLPKLNR